jgi:hypothetical protein
MCLTTCHGCAGVPSSPPVDSSSRVPVPDDDDPQTGPLSPDLFKGQAGCLMSPSYPDEQHFSAEGLKHGNDQEGGPERGRQEECNGDRHEDDGDSGKEPGAVRVAGEHGQFDHDDDKEESCCAGGDQSSILHHDRMPLSDGFWSQIDECNATALNAGPQDAGNEANTGLLAVSDGAKGRWAA